MKAYLRALLCSLCLLAPRRSSSQPVAPLRPLVVRLDSGTVLRRTLFGVDTAYYRQVRLKAAEDQVQLDLRAARIANYQRQQRLADSLAAGLLAQSVRERAALAQANADFDKAHAQATQALMAPARPVLLLDSHFYTGLGIGGLLGLVASFFIHF